MPLEMDDDLMEDAGRSGGGINFSNSDDDDVGDDADDDDDNEATRPYDSDVDDIMEEEDAPGDDDREEGGGQGDAVVVVLLLPAAAPLPGALKVAHRRRRRRREGTRRTAMVILSQFLLCPILFCTQKQVAVANAYATGQKVMGRANLWLGKLLPGSPEDLCFCAFFGVSAQVSVTARDMMENHSVLPPTPEFLHFLWALAFMHTYPANDTTLSCLLGGRNPKTMRKYMCWKKGERALPE